MYHTAPQANQSTNSASAAKHEKTHKVSALTLQIRVLQSRLHRQEADLRLVRLRLAKLHGEIAGLDQEIKNIEREKSGKATWWGYFTSILQGHQETEEQRIKRDNDRLQKIAARSIRDSEVQRQIAVVRGLENAIDATHRSITSAEIEILTEKSREEREGEKRRMEEERLRQETSRRMAEELKKQQERQAQQASRGHKYPSREQGVNGSRNSGQSEGKQNFHDTVKKHAITKAGGAELMFVSPAVVAYPLLESSYFSVLVVVSWPVPRAGIPSRAEDLDQIVSAKVPMYHDSSQFTDYTSKERGRLNMVEQEVL